MRKILRSLPKRFDMKVTDIEEAQDISSVKVDELIGSLQNFEITINSKEIMKIMRHKEIMKMMKTCQSH